MPGTQLFFYKEGDKAPVHEWLSELRRKDRRGFAKCVARIRELAQYGHIELGDREGDGHE